MNLTANWSYPTAIRFGNGRIAEIGTGPRQGGTDCGGLCLALDPLDQQLANVIGIAANGQLKVATIGNDIVFYRILYQDLQRERHYLFSIAGRR